MVKKVSESTNIKKIFTSIFKNSQEFNKTKNILRESSKDNDKNKDIIRDEPENISAKDLFSFSLESGIKNISQFNKLNLSEKESRILGAKIVSNLEEINDNLKYYIKKTIDNQDTSINKKSKIKNRENTTKIEKNIINDSKNSGFWGDWGSALGFLTLGLGGGLTLKGIRGFLKNPLLTTKSVVKSGIQNKITNPIKEGFRNRITNPLKENIQKNIKNPLKEGFRNRITNPIKELKNTKINNFKTGLNNIKSSTLQRISNTKIGSNILDKFSKTKEITSKIGNSFSKVGNFTSKIGEGLGKIPGLAKLGKFGSKILAPLTLADAAWNIGKGVYDPSQYGADSKLEGAGWGLSKFGAGTLDTISGAGKFLFKGITGQGWDSKNFTEFNSFEKDIDDAIEAKKTLKEVKKKEKDLENKKILDSSKYSWQKFINENVQIFNKFDNNQLLRFEKYFNTENNKNFEQSIIKFLKHNGTTKKEYEYISNILNNFRLYKTTETKIKTINNNQLLKAVIGYIVKERGLNDYFSSYEGKSPKELTEISKKQKSNIVILKDGTVLPYQDLYNLKKLDKDDIFMVFISQFKSKLYSTDDKGNQLKIWDKMLEIWEKEEGPIFDKGKLAGRIYNTLYNENYFYKSNNKTEFDKIIMEDLNSNREKFNIEHEDNYVSGLEESKSNKDLEGTEKTDNIKFESSNNISELSSEESEILNVSTKINPKFADENYKFASENSTIKSNIIESYRNVFIPIKNKFKDAYLTSAFRYPKYNSSVGGTSGSQHTKGLAYDIKFKNHTIEEVVQEIADRNVPGLDYQNTYALNEYGSWLHADYKGKHKGKVSKVMKGQGFSNYKVKEIKEVPKVNDIDYSNNKTINNVKDLETPTNNNQETKNININNINNQSTDVKGLNRISDSFGDFSDNYF